ncbi:MAG: hypothetical protein HW414_1481 [Dehalococcoidia bacterium]|nr:hypothetical protein [Dehalococcoidia bacterium]
MNTIRALVRPVLTLAGMLTISALVYQGKPVPELYAGMVVGMLAWWFYDRSRGKTKP